MGIIKAFNSAIGSGLADQWLEVIEADAMSDTTVFCKGVKVRANDKRTMRRSSNKRGSEDLISNGSVIHVYPNQFMMLVDGGRVVERTMNTGDRGKGVAITNRSGTAVDIGAALNRALSLRWEQTDQPQVLILHTHTTEGYMTYAADYYNAEDRHRTHDHTRNVCAVGEALRLALAAYGIVAIHDTTVHDSPVYSGAYTRSAETAKAYLEQYPSIRVVLDLHRDSVEEGGALVRPTAVVEGKKAAQMMLITGVVSTEGLPHPRWEQNLTLAAHWQAALDGVSPDLMRPLNLTASRYNQHLSPGWVLVEVGAEGNTIEEAVYSAQILGRTLAELLG